MTKAEMSMEVKDAMKAMESFEGNTEETSKPGPAETEQSGTKQAEKKKTEQKRAGKSETSQKKNINPEIGQKTNELTEVQQKKQEAALSREFKKRAGVISKNIANIENSFLMIAFNLHWIYENKMYKQAGAKNIYDYAESEYGLGKTTCSNLICIINNFAERDENGKVIEKIAECYRRFKQSQLVALIGMSPDEISKVDEKTSVRKIIQMRKDAEIVQGASDAENKEEVGSKTENENESETDKNETIKKVVNTLIQFDNLLKYKREVETVDVLIERAFRASGKNGKKVTIKIVCEQV